MSTPALRMATLFGQTLRNAPADADTEGHRLLLRAAFIRQLGAGLYTAMPLGWRSLQRVMSLIRQEMNGKVTLAAMAMIRRPGVPVVSIGVLTAAAFVPFLVHRNGIAGLLEIPLFAWYLLMAAAQRLWFASVFTVTPLSVRGTFRRAPKYFGRTFRLALLVGAAWLAIATVIDKTSSGALRLILLVALAFLADAALTFVLPALVFSTRSAILAIQFGLVVARRTWPHSAVWVIAAPLALQAIALLSPTSWLVAIVAYLATAVIGLLIKGATLVSYLSRIRDVPVSARLGAALRRAPNAMSEDNP